MSKTPDELDKILGKLLKAQRNAKRKYLKEAAVITKVTEGQVSKWESGTDRVTLKNALLLLNYYGSNLSRFNKEFLLACKEI